MTPGEPRCSRAETLTKTTTRVVTATTRTLVEEMTVTVVEDAEIAREAKIVTFRSRTLLEATARVAARDATMKTIVTTVRETAMTAEATTTEEKRSPDVRLPRKTLANKLSFSSPPTSMRSLRRKSPRKESLSPAKARSPRTSNLLTI